MGFHAKQFISETGLQYDAASRTFYGHLHGFPVFVQDYTRKKQMIFRLVGKQRSIRDLSSILHEWRLKHAGINLLQYANNMLTCVFSLSGRKADSIALENTGALTALAAELDLVPCCAGCGAETDYALYLLDGSGVTLCPDCVTYTQGNMEKDTAAHAAAPVSVIGSIFGAVIGGIAVFALTYAVLEMNTLSFLTAYVGMLLGLILIKKLGKKVTLPAVGLAVVLGLAAAFAAPVMSYAHDFAKFNQEQEQNAKDFIESYDNLSEALVGLSSEEISQMEEELGETVNLSAYSSRYEACKLMLDNQTTKDCLQNFITLLNCDTYSDVKPELIKCIVWGLLSVLIGTGITAPPMLLAGKGKHSLRELAG